MRVETDPEAYLGSYTDTDSAWLDGYFDRTWKLGDITQA
jgi:hypothetical protein